MSQSIFKKRVKVEISHNLGQELLAKTAAATGVSKNSVRIIVSAGKVIDKERTRKAKVRFEKLDNFDVGVIRRIIHNLYRENISPSLKKILLQLKEKMNFPYGKTHGDC